MEFMSNVSGSSGFDPDKPSLFEIISEKQLRELLEPSIRYLLAVVTQRHPRYLIHIVNRFDEVYALGMLLVERHYLKTWGGSFTENFYGMKRERVLVYPNLQRTSKNAPAPLREITKLRDVDIWRSLFVMVGVPYIKCKLDDAYEIHFGGAASSLFGTNYRPRQNEPDENASMKDKIMHKLKGIFQKVYPSVNAAYYISMLLFNLAYLFDKSYYHTPFDWLIGVRMRRLTEVDYRAYEAKTNRPRPGLLPALSFWSMFSPKIFTKIILPKLLDSLKVLLQTSIFFLKFLEWWYASDFARQLSSKAAGSVELSTPLQAAPPPTEEDRKGADRKLVELPEDSKICPICLSDITNPAAIQTGYVFCYPCIFRWIEDDERVYCPVTGAKLLGGSDGLRRIMI